MYKQTHSVYGIGLHNIHRACIHFKSITSGSTSLNETCDLRLKHSHTTSLANQNMYLVSSKQIILLWAWQHFHCTTLPTLAENNSISSTTLANQNMYLVSSKQIILLWAWQNFHCITLLTLAENNSISSTTLPLASLCSHL